MNSFLLAVEAESESHNKKRVAIEDEDPIAEFTHQIVWMRLDHTITAVLQFSENWTDRNHFDRNSNTACRTVLHFLKLHRLFFLSG